jgi:hypothetical protein
VETTRETWIEDLVRDRPAAVRLLRERGIGCLACGEPIWGTLEEAARDEGLSESEVDRVVRELDALESVRGRMAGGAAPG